MYKHIASTNYLSVPTKLALNDTLYICDKNGIIYLPQVRNSSFRLQ